jgi:hypothetical protein
MIKCAGLTNASGTSIWTLTTLFLSGTYKQPQMLETIRCDQMITVHGN